MRGEEHTGRQGCMHGEVHAGGRGLDSGSHSGAGLRGVLWHGGSGVPGLMLFPKSLGLAQFRVLGH